MVTNLFHYKAILLLSCPYTGIKLPVQVTTSVSCTPNPSNKYYQCHYRPTHYQENNEVSFNCNTWIIQWYLLWPSRIRIIMMQTSLWCSALQPLKCPIIHRTWTSVAKFARCTFISSLLHCTNFQSHSCNMVDSQVISIRLFGSYYNGVLCWSLIHIIIAIINELIRPVYLKNIEILWYPY